MGKTIDTIAHECYQLDLFNTGIQLSLFEKPGELYVVQSEIRDPMYNPNQLKLQFPNEERGYSGTENKSYTL